MARKDFKFTDGDIDISTLTGDFVVTDSDQEHIEDLIQATPNDFKQFPQVGAIALMYLNAPSDQLQDLRREIIIQLKADGYKNIQVELSDGEVSVTADPKF